MNRRKNGEVFLGQDTSSPLIRLLCPQAEARMDASNGLQVFFPINRLPEFGGRVVRYLWDRTQGQGCNEPASAAYSNVILPNP